MVITIDGPTASGKSTLASQLSDHLGWYYLNSGLLFRGLGYILMDKYKYGYQDLLSPDLELVRACITSKKFVYSYDSVGKEALIFDNTIITMFLKNERIDKAASIISLDQDIRDIFVAYQRDLANKYNIVVDGRDTGSVVFPDAAIKFFLTASIDVRARRWQADQKARGKVYLLKEAQKIITERDERDSKRAIAPLIVPAQACLIDSSYYTQEELFNTMIDIIHNKFITNNYVGCQDYPVRQL